LYVRRKYDLVFIYIIVVAMEVFSMSNIDDQE